MSDRILNRKERRTRVGLSEPTLWRMERSGKFPARRKLSPGRVGWIESEVDQWISERQKAFRGGGAK
jgi:prophage regulatory protein